jgi:hypothetical protein
MTEAKRCWQTDYLPTPTVCFQKAGNIPCETAGCTVDDAIASLGKDTSVTSDQILYLCHTACRMSSVSVDNREFLARMAAQGEKHLLSILE